VRDGIKEKEFNTEDPEHTECTEKSEDRKRSREAEKQRSREAEKQRSRSLTSSGMTDGERDK
jgi:hypothetical protein